MYSSEAAEYSISKSQVSPLWTKGEGSGAVVSASQFQFNEYPFQSLLSSGTSH